MAAGVRQGGQRGGLQPALPGGGRQGAIGAGGVSARALGLQLLLPEEAQEEVLERGGAQPSGIEGGTILDEPVALEGLGDARKGRGFEAVLGESAEQEHSLERRVGRCCRRRSIHAPGSAPRGTEGTERTDAALEKVNRRHDLPARRVSGHSSLRAPRRLHDAAATVARRRARARARQSAAGRRAKLPPSLTGQSDSPSLSPSAGDRSALLSFRCVRRAAAAGAIVVCPTVGLVLIFFSFFAVAMS